MKPIDQLGLGPKREVVVHEDGSATVTVTAPEIFVPGAKPVTVELNADQFGGYKAWQRGALIQNVLFDLSASDREKLMTGLE